MDELIGQITATTGVDEPIARRSAGIIINFLAHNAPASAVDPLLDALPGARQLAAESGGGSSGLMGIFGELTEAGLGMGDIQPVARALVDYARAKAGQEKIDAVVSAIPGLSQFV
jgi:hypothetical protein